MLPNVIEIGTPAGDSLKLRDGPSVILLNGRQGRRVQLQQLDRPLTDADSVFDEEIEQLVTIDESDGGDTGFEGGFLRTLGKLRSRDDGPAHSVEAMERTAERIQILARNPAPVTFDLHDLTDRRDADLDLTDHVDTPVSRLFRDVHVLVLHPLQQSLDQMLEDERIHIVEQLMQAVANRVRLLSNQGPDFVMFVPR